MSDTAALDWLSVGTAKSTPISAPTPVPPAPGVVVDATRMQPAYRVLEELARRESLGLHDLVRACKGQAELAGTTHRDLLRAQERLAANAGNDEVRLLTDDGWPSREFRDLVLHCVEGEFPSYQLRAL